MSAKILWGIVGGFLFGVFVRSIIFIPWPFTLFLCTLALVAIFFAWIDISSQTRFVVIAVLLSACAAGILRMDAASLVGDPNLTKRIGSSVTIVGRVVEEPDQRESNTRIHLKIGTIIYDSESISVQAGILVIAPLHAGAAYGDTVRAEGKLQLPESFETTDGRQFNYPMFLAKDGILYMLSFAKVEVIEEGYGNPIKAGAIWVKQKFLSGLHLALPEPEAGLAGGITVGDKRSIGKDLSATFQIASLIHVVVLSGYNITLVINFIRGMLLRAPRIIQHAGIGASVILIVLMTGGAASATRAGAMALIAVFARATARTFFALRILGVVATAMVLWNPLYLAFDPGFQLSILATLGLILFTPIFSAWLPWIPEKYMLREIAASTLGTQIVVLPLLLYQNGLFSLVALPANLLALVAVPYAMFASIVAAIAGILAGPLSVFIAIPAYALLRYIIAIAQFFAALPFSSISIPAFSAWWLALAYGIIFAGYFYVQKRNGRG